MNLKQLVFMCIISLTSCSGPKMKNVNKQVAKETPKVLQEERNDIGSFSRSADDLIEELYKELSDTIPVLKEIDNNITDINTKKENLYHDFEIFSRKNTLFYDLADRKITLIKDSTLKSNLKNLIKESISKYEIKTTEVNALKQIIENKRLSINDYYVVLMVVKTLPLIEKYQKDFLPDPKTYKELIKEQNAIIKKMTEASTK